MQVGKGWTSFNVGAIMFPKSGAVCAVLSGVCSSVLSVVQSVECGAVCGEV